MGVPKARPFVLPFLFNTVSLVVYGDGNDFSAEAEVRHQKRLQQSICFDTKRIFGTITVLSIRVFLYVRA
jgi:hypothetical protein